MAFDAKGEKQPFAQCLRWLVFSHESHKFRLYGILWRREKDCHRMQSERIAVRNVSIGISFSTFSTEILLVRLNASLLVHISFFFSLISATCKRKFQINTQNTHTCTTDKKNGKKKQQQRQQNIESDKKNAIHTCNAQTKRFMFNWSWLTCQFSHRLLLFHVQNGDFKAIALLKHLNATQPVDVIRLTIADTRMLQFFLE